MSNATKTEAQAARSFHRDGAGRMKKNACECCGKGAPMDYYSETDIEGREWTALCFRCARKIVKAKGQA